MPIRQYPSYPAMRQADGRQQTSLESSINNGHHGQSNCAYQKIFSPIGVPDFQEFPTRRPTTVNPNTTSRARFDASSPIPSHFPPSVYSQELLRSRSLFIQLWGSSRADIHPQRSKRCSYARPLSSERAQHISQRITSLKNVFG